MIGRVRGKGTFADLRAGRRGSAGPLTVVFLGDAPDGSSPAPGARGDARVAFAIGRRVGGAVVRNRVRRRLREHLRALDARSELRSGAYLVIVRRDATRLDFRSLGEHLEKAVARATEARSSGGHEAGEPARRAVGARS